jgi:hypothetical protein
MTQNSLEEEKQYEGMSKMVKATTINATGAGSGTVERLERKNSHGILVL